MELINHHPKVNGPYYDFLREEQTRYALILLDFGFGAFFVLLAWGLFIWIEYLARPDMYNW